jgi:hypothetical protein
MLQDLSDWTGLNQSDWVRQAIRSAHAATRAQKRGVR